jgi:predicted DNA-binding protein
MAKDAALRIRLSSELHQQFLEVCKAQDKPAAQVLREYMRSYVQRNKDLIEEDSSDDKSKGMQ